MARPRSLGVQPGDRDVALDGVDAGDAGAEPRHRLGQQAAAAADVEQREACQGAGRQRVAAMTGGDAVADEGDARRVELVQRPELALRVPPGLGHGGELRGLHGIDAGAARGRRFAVAGCGIGHAVHRREFLVQPCLCQPE